MDPKRIFIAVLLIIGAIYFIQNQPKEPEPSQTSTPTTPVPTVTSTTAPPITPIEGMYTPDATTYTPTPLTDARVWQIYSVDNDNNLINTDKTMTLYKNGTITTTLPSDILGIKDLKYTGNSWSGQIIQNGQLINFPLSFKESQKQIVFYSKNNNILFVLAPVPAPTTPPPTPAPTTRPPTPVPTTSMPITKAPTTAPPIPAPFYSPDRYNFPIIGRYVTIYKEMWDFYKLSTDKKKLDYDTTAITTLVLKNLEIYGEDDKKISGKYTQIYSKGNTVVQEKDSNGTVISSTNTLNFLLQEDKETIVKSSLSQNPLGSYVVIDLGSNLQISRILVTGNLAYDTILTIFADPDPKVFITDRSNYDCTKKLVSNDCKFPYEGKTFPPVTSLKNYNELEKAAKASDASSEIKTYYKYLDAVNNCKLTCGFDLGRIGISPPPIFDINTMDIGRRITIKNDINVINTIIKGNPYLITYQLRIPPCILGFSGASYYTTSLDDSVKLRPCDKTAVECKMDIINNHKNNFLNPSYRSVKFDLSFSKSGNDPAKVNIIEETSGTITNKGKVIYSFDLNKPNSIIINSVTFSNSSTLQTEKDYYNFFIKHFINTNDALSLSPSVAK